MKDVSMKKWVLHQHIVASNSVSHQNVQWNFWEAVDHFGKSCVKKSFEIGQPFWWKFEFFLQPPWLTFARKKNMGFHQLLQQTYAMIYEKIDDRCGNIMGIMPLVLLDNLQYERIKFDWQLW